MKSKQIIQLAGIAALLVVAGLIDFVYYHLSFGTEITFSSRLFHFLIHFQSLIVILFYVVFFVAAFQMIKLENPNHLQTWIIFMIGVIIVLLVGVLPYSGRVIRRYLPDQIFLFEHTYLKLVFHYGAMLTAMGLVQLGRQFLQKKHAI